MHPVQILGLSAFRGSRGLGYAQTPHAGIFLSHDIALNDRQLLSDAAQVLRRLDSQSGRPIRRSTKRAALMADHFGVSVKVQRIPDDAPYLSVRILLRKGETADETLARRILAQTVRGMLSHIPVDSIDWFDCETLIEPDEFREMFAPPAQEADYSPSAPPHMDFALSEHLREMMAVEEQPGPNLIAETAELAPPAQPRRQPPERRRAEPAESKPQRRRFSLILIPFRMPKLLWTLWRGMDTRLMGRVLALVALAIVFTNTDLLRDALTQLLR